MAKQIVALKTAKTAASRRPVRQAITLEAVHAITPSEVKADSRAQPSAWSPFPTLPSARTSRSTWSASPTSCATI